MLLIVKYISYLFYHFIRLFFLWYYISEKTVCEIRDLWLESSKLAYLFSWTEIINKYAIRYLIHIWFHQSLGSFALSKYKISAPVVPSSKFQVNSSHCCASQPSEETTLFSPSAQKILQTNQTNFTWWRTLILYR